MSSFSMLDEYLRFYQKFLLTQWENVGPQEYVTMLLSVGVIGWYMMRKAARM